jgi:hypothetical protein
VEAVEGFGCGLVEEGIEGIGGADGKLGFEGAEALEVPGGMAEDIEDAQRF